MSTENENRQEGSVNEENQNVSRSLLTINNNKFSNYEYGRTLYLAIWDR